MPIGAHPVTVARAPAPKPDVPRIIAAAGVGHTRSRRPGTHFQSHGSQWIPASTTDSGRKPPLECGFPCVTMRDR